jgi:hypothetical protein
MLSSQIMLELFVTEINRRVKCMCSRNTLNVFILLIAISVFTLSDRILHGMFRYRHSQRKPQTPMDIDIGC